MEYPFGRLNDYIGEGMNVQTAKDTRIVAINIGVPSEEALEKARTFWEAVLGVKLENRRGQSWQVLLGPDGAQGRLNIRLRSADEPHHSHELQKLPVSDRAPDSANARSWPG